MEVYPGQIVHSKTGRDKGHTFIILESIDENYVSICDGDLRKIDKPKKKRLKHLLFFDAVAEDIQDKIKNGDRVTNAELRKSLSAFHEELEKEKQESNSRD